jgi:hypothetical protein
MTVIDISDVRRRRERSKEFTSLKLTALDCAMVDHRLTDLDFRVLYYLASAADRETQTARRKQKVIADALGVSRRAVQISAERLSEFQYVAILTKDGGTYTNGYRLILENANEGSPSENTKANPASPFAQKRRTRTPKKANENAEKGEPPFAPTLPFNSLEIPWRLRGPSGAKALGPAGAMLRSKFGDDKFASWFGKVTLKSETPDMVTLEAPTGFIRDYIKTHFATDVLQVWQTISPTITHIEIVTKRARGNQ